LDLLEAAASCGRLSSCAFATRLNPGMVRMLQGQNVRSADNAPENVGRLIVAAENILNLQRDDNRNASTTTTTTTTNSHNSVRFTEAQQVLALIEAAVMTEGPGALACAHRNERPTAIEPGVVRCVCLYGRDCSRTEEELETEALRSATSASDSASSLGIAIFVLFAFVAVLMLLKHILDSLRMASRGKSIDMAG
jgi:hypothetical protein